MAAPLDFHGEVTKVVGVGLGDVDLGLSLGGGEEEDVELEEVDRADVVLEVELVDVGVCDLEDVDVELVVREELVVLGRSWFETSLLFEKSSLDWDSG